VTDYSRRALSAGLDQRLIQYSKRSWNAHEAVAALEQLNCLIPIYTSELTDLYGRNALGAARRCWGIFADLCSAITQLPPTMETLLDLGFEAAADVGHLIAPYGDLVLHKSPVLEGLDFRPASRGDIDPVLRQALAHDTVAKPLLELFRDEMRSFDFEALGADESDRVTTFGDLMHRLAAAPTEFPWWEGRPLFLEEQRGFIEYLCRHVGAEIVADHLVDEELGMFVLYMAKCLKRSSTTGNVVIDSAKVPHRLVARPIGVLCHQVGNSILDGINTAFGVADVYDRLHIAEKNVLDQFDLDISLAFESTRELATERGLEAMATSIIDLRDSPIRRAGTFEAMSFKYEFPELGKD
jgi:hypothetical protein